MKKILILALTCLMALSMVACKKEVEAPLDISTAETPDIPFAIYSETDNSLSFYRNQSINDLKVGDIYKEKIVSEIYYDFTSKETAIQTDIPWNAIRDKIEKVYVVDNIPTASIAYWFCDFINCNYFDVSNLNVTACSNMAYAFYKAGSEKHISEFTIIGMDTWNVNNVWSMISMFESTGTFAKTWNIGTLSNWETTNLKECKKMFYNAAINANSVSLNLENFKLDKVRETDLMFANFAEKATEFSIGNISNWNMENISTIKEMFSNMAPRAEYSLDISTWNTANISSYSNYNLNIENKITAPMFKQF